MGRKKIGASKTTYLLHERGDVFWLSDREQHPNNGLICSSVKWAIESRRSSCYGRVRINEGRSDLKNRRCGLVVGGMEKSALQRKKSALE